MRGWKLRALISGLILLAAAAAALWLARRNLAQSAALARLESENRELKGALARLSAESRRLSEQLAAAQNAEAPAPIVIPTPRPGASQAEIEQARLLAQLKEKLSASSTSMAEMENRVAELEAYAQKVSEENRRLAASETELRETAASSRRIAEALQAELKSRSDRLVQSEVQNRTLKESASRAEERSARLSKVLQEIEDINRRRENYLTNLMRRYREITDGYRATALRMDNARGGGSPPPGELSRLETALAQAEEDLRQIASLNAQAQRAQAKLGK